MYIVRWLMGHPIIAAWVLGALALLLTLGHEEKNKTGEQNSVIIEQSDDTAVSSREEPKQAVEGTEAESQNKSNQQGADNNTPATQTQEVDSPKSDSTTMQSENNALSTNTGSLIENAETSVSEKLSSSASQVAPTTVASPDLETVNTDELLQMAREAFWNNGLDEAADLYSKLIEMQPNVIEYKGELGNVYWKQGHPKKAATLYLEIAAPMIDSGHSAKVENMIGFIGLFFPEEAADLSIKIQPK